ncbi:WD40/YVTN/BNR-like repeat-containing protein [Massilia cavernae]|nr:YCF48-related protein [Massilia cavernae]
MAQAAPNTFNDPIDVAAPASTAAARDMLVGGERTPDGRLVVVGRRGVILTSDPDGARWKQSKVPVSTDLLAASFPTALKGWAVGHAGVVLHTSDGGLSWTRQVDGRALPDLMIRHSKARAEAGDERAQHELKEAQRYKEDGPSRPLFDVYFSDDARGIVVGAYNLALRTDDGGRSWLPISDRIDNPQGLHLYGIAQVDGVLWIAGEQGLVLRQDAGTGRFVRVPLPYAGTLFGITGNAGEVLVFGLRGNAWRSRDGGANWSRLDTGIEGHLTAGAILAGGRVVLTSLGGELIESRDGERFRKVPLARTAPLYGVSAASDGKLLLTGARGVHLATVEASGAVHHTPALAARAGKSASREAR